MSELRMHIAQSGYLYCSKTEDLYFPRPIVYIKSYFPSLFAGDVLFLVSKQ